MAKVENNRQDIDANEVIVCAVTWKDFVQNTAPPTGNVLSSEWDGAEAVTIHEDDLVDNQALVKVSVPGGEVGEVYRVTNHVEFTDSEPRQSRDATLILRVVEN